MKYCPANSASKIFHLSLGVCLLVGVVFTGCGGGGGGDLGVPGSGTGSGANYGFPQANLYDEVPPIDVTGGGVSSSDVLFFIPKGPKNAELYDSDEDGVPDTPINEYLNFVNAANNMYDQDIAACLGANLMGSFTPAYQPDTMPGKAINGTQYIQIVFPFDLDPDSVFDGSPLNFGSDFLKGTISIFDDKNEHVPCTVLLDGKDGKYYFDPSTHPQGDDYTSDPNWPDEITVATNVLVLIAQAQVDQVTGALPTVDTAFTSSPGSESTWASDKYEVRIRIGEIKDTIGNPVPVNANYAIMKTAKPEDYPKPNLAPTDITAFDIIGVDTDIDPDTGEPYKEPNNLIIDRETSFILTFNKPVVPESVARSLIFDRPPFNGNSKVVINKYFNTSSPPSACATITPPPLGTNVSIIATFIGPNGASQSQAVIPFRCTPLHQNNLAIYIINPLIDLPGSTPKELGLLDLTKIRVEITVYPAGTNANTGDPDDYGPMPPVNLAPTGFFGETYTGGGQVISRIFTVGEGGRYVNAPVCPNALYYTMGPEGIGVVDLDGNGFTTNHPDLSKPALVTSLRFYNVNGNAGLNNGNQYAYGAKANPGKYVGLGATTPVPGINEGSDGIDTVVKDSLGRGRLHPDPTGNEKFYNITDLEVGDFLDAMFFDTSNRWVKSTYHVSFILLGLQGKFKNNMIDTPPTPNPPPLTIPVGMRAVDVVVDETGMLLEGAFVIMGKEVFATPTHLGVFPPNIQPFDTTFIHLNPAEMCNPPSAVDQPFPPNPTTGFLADFINTGPLAESSTLGTGFTYGSRQQIGNFLFAADKGNNIVRVINSNSMELITMLTGFSQPDSVAISTDLSILYVTNSGNGYVSVFDVDPQSADFLSNIAEVDVGDNPRGLCVQPDQEDVLVCNFGSSNISIIDYTTNTVRKTISSLISKPWDLVAGPRQSTFGLRTQVYHAYISNFGGGNILVFESGPDGLGGVGYDDILDPVSNKGAGGQQFMAIENPRGICWDTHFVQPNYLNGGCFVAHRSGSYAMVSRIQFTKQQGGAGPIFLQSNSGAIGGTPGFGKRMFEIVAQWGGPQNPLSPGSGAASDVALIDYYRDMWLHNNWTGNPYCTNYGAVDNNPTYGLPVSHKHPTRILTFWGITQYHPTALSDRLYVSFAFSPVIDVINPIDGSLVKTITGLPSPAKVLKTYFKY